MAFWHAVLLSTRVFGFRSGCTHKSLPPQLDERRSPQALVSVAWATPRCSVKELQMIRRDLMLRFGAELHELVTEHAECTVNQKLQYVVGISRFRPATQWKIRSFAASAQIQVFGSAARYLYGRLDAERHREGERRRLVC